MDGIFGEKNLGTLPGVLIMMCSLFSDDPQVMTRSPVESAAPVVPV